MSKIALLITTVGNIQGARDLAGSLLNHKLVACANAIKVENAAYFWEGKLENTEEYLLLMKTTKSKLSDLKVFLEEHHPYDIPLIIELEVGSVNRAYHEWLSSQVL